MARPTSSTQMGSSNTATITLENPSPQQQQTLVLRLSQPLSLKKKVSWKEGTVDNEFLQRKSSKKCCIFHKEKSFEEDDSDDDDHMHDSCQSEKHSQANGGGVGTSGCHSAAE
ncbi:hypothetical protein IFM89_019332 [Coptis chinensis]|uniref:Uncharacterized protein n=1 Tax=Coptis chinensis TaxID=261450 RepID=A0A835I3I2_9MAGN|nr:hypothetical protein IFM89_019332 [Coptis chinensis]